MGLFIFFKIHSNHSHTIMKVLMLLMALCVALSSATYNRGGYYGNRGVGGFNRGYGYNRGYGRGRYGGYRNNFRGNFGYRGNNRRFSNFGGM